MKQLRLNIKPGIRLTVKALTLLVLMAACSKKEKEADNEPESNVVLNEMEKKITGSWSLESAVVYRGGAIPPMTDETKTCDKDDVFTFKHNKKYDVVIKDEICSSIIQIYKTQTTDNEWYVRDDSLLRFPHFITYMHVSNDFKITEITTDKLVLEQRYFDMGSNRRVNTYIRRQ